MQHEGLQLLVRRDCAQMRVEQRVLQSVDEAREEFLRPPLEPSRQAIDVFSEGVSCAGIDAGPLEECLVQLSEPAVEGSELWLSAFLRGWRGHTTRPVRLGAGEGSTLSCH